MYLFYIDNLYIPYKGYCQSLFWDKNCIFCSGKKSIKCWMRKCTFCQRNVDLYSLINTTHSLFFIRLCRKMVMGIITMRAFICFINTFFCMSFVNLFKRLFYKACWKVNKFKCKQENKTVILLNMQSLFLANMSLIHTLMHFNYLIIQKLNEKVAFLFISNEFGFVIRTNRFQWLVDLKSTSLCT